MSLLPPVAEPRHVLAADGVPLATYDLGEPDGPVVVAVHGFASSAHANWVATGWVRELGRAGFRVLAWDQRGHGLSGRPTDPAAYSMDLLVDDARAVLDTHLIGEAAWVGYSLGARVGWYAARTLEHVLTRAVLGGLSAGDPLLRFRLDEARAELAGGPPARDALTRTYLDMAAATPGNDLRALVALVEGMRGRGAPDPAEPPRQPLLVAVGSEDPALATARVLAGASDAELLVVPGRDHFSAPTERGFRLRARDFLLAGV